MRHFADLLPLALHPHVPETPVSQMSSSMSNVTCAVQGCSVGCNQQVVQVTGLGSPDVTRSTYAFGGVNTFLAGQPMTDG